jgi:hypothetical protein
VHQLGGYRAVSLSLGGLLLVAAALKLYGLSFSAIPPVGWLASPSVQMLAVLWELVLGLWLVSGYLRTPAWLFTLLTFTVFAVVSGYLGLQGVASCGCFGVIAASPWYAFGLDVLAIAALLLFRPTWNALELRAFAKPASRVALGAVVVFGGLALAAYGLFGSIDTALARLRGDDMGAPSFVDLGEGNLNERLEAQAAITNYSDRPIRLIGGTSDCSCITTSDMPLTIPPGATVPVSVVLRIPGSSTVGQLTRTAELWTDNDKHRKIRLRLGAKVRPTPP